MDNQKKVHRRLTGKAVIYVGSVGFACCSWEGRHPCRPLPMLESLTGISALGDILDVHVGSKAPVVDTEVDPPR